MPAATMTRPKAVTKKKAKKKPEAKPKAAKKSGKERSDLALLVGTVKGGFLVRPEGGRRRWELAGPYFLGSRVHDFQLDPRDGRTLLMCSTGGHLGPTIYRSTNRGKTWKEAERPPQFEKLAEGAAPAPETASAGQAVQINFWLSPGHASEPGVWYCGTSPQGLFRSVDGGRTWDGLAGFNAGPKWWEWTNGGRYETPGGALVHSICVDPRDKGHMLISLSLGGTFESHDQGATWAPLNRGVAADFSPVKDPEHGHDPHCMILHPANADRFYQQNHCGIYRLDRDRGERWDRIGDNMPKRIGDIGFPMVGHPADPDTVWVFPMDGTSIWPRTSPGGKPAVYRTRNGGRRWQRLDDGLPARNAFYTVLRQAMCADDHEKNTGLYFGTTSGEVWASRNGGERWSRIIEHLPKVFSVRAARFR